MAQIDRAVDLRKKMLNQEMKKEKELEKRVNLIKSIKLNLSILSGVLFKERLSSINSPSLMLRERSRSIKSESESKEVCYKINSQATSVQNQRQFIEFSPFQIEFAEPIRLKINCIKLLRYEQENSFSSYMAIDLDTNQMFTVYQWQVSLERNKVFEEKKFEMCETEVNN